MDGEHRSLDPPDHVTSLRPHPPPLRTRIGLPRGSFGHSHLLHNSLLYRLTSHQRELRSAGPAPTRAAAIPHLLTTLTQQKMQFLRAVTVPENSGQRVKISSPFSRSLFGP
jgi:hypothetical protein